MIFREAQADDISQIQIVRNSVTEKTLSNPDLVSDEDSLEIISKRGKGWVCNVDNKVVGFSIVDLQENNIWALLLKPEHEKKGIGTKHQQLMLDWYFDQTNVNVWLGTTPETRTEIFYRKSGWKEIANHGGVEIKIEMTYEQWLINNQ